jgi:hypothetical protein
MSQVGGWLWTVIGIVGVVTGVTEMTDAKRKDKAPDERANLGQQEAADERLGKDKMEHMGDRRREAEKSPRRQNEPQRHSGS